MAEKTYKPPINEPLRPRRGAHKGEEREEDKVPFDDVQALIRREEEAALFLFRESDFDRSIKKRIHAENLTKKRILRLLPFPFPSPVRAITAILLVLLIAVPAVVYLMSPSNADKEFRELRDYFAQIPTPGETRDEDQPRTPNTISPEYAALEKNFRRALYKAYLRNQDMTADNLTRIFDQVLHDTPLPEQEEKLRITDPRDLEERIKTMIGEKQVYKTLSRVTQKT